VRPEQKAESSQAELALPAAAEVQERSEPEPQPESRAQRASQRLAQPPLDAPPAALEQSPP